MLSRASGYVEQRGVRELSPPPRGGVAATPIVAKHPLWSGRGGDLIPPEFLFVADHHPVCAAKDASQLFLDRAATSPRRGGEKRFRRHNCMSSSPKKTSNYEGSHVRHCLSGTGRRVKRANTRHNVRGVRRAAKTSGESYESANCL